MVGYNITLDSQAAEKIGRAIYDLVTELRYSRADKLSGKLRKLHAWAECGITQLAENLGQLERGEVREWLKK